MASSARSFNDVYFPGYGVPNRLAPDGGFAWPWYGGGTLGRVTGLQYGDAPAPATAQQNDLPHWLTDINARGLAGDWIPDAHVTPDVQTPGYRDFSLNPAPPDAATPAAPAVTGIGAPPSGGAAYDISGGGSDGEGPGAGPGSGAQGEASSDSGASAGSDSGSEGGGPGGGGGADGGGPGGGSGGEGDGGGFSSGGLVTRNRLSGPDPDGPDDGYAALNAGEGVLTAKAMKYYGPAFLARLNRLAVPKGAADNPTRRAGSPIPTRSGAMHGPLRSGPSH